MRSWPPKSAARVACPRRDAAGHEPGKERAVPDRKETHWGKQKLKRDERVISPSGVSALYHADK
jgi:hypothetical protein